MWSSWNKKSIEPLARWILFGLEMKGGGKSFYLLVEKSIKHSD